MSLRTFVITYQVVIGVTLVAEFFPYQRFSIAVEYSTIIKIVMACVVIGMSIRLALYTR
jgi:hypothetical protein